MWNKTPEETVNKIKELLNDFTLRYADIAALTGVCSLTVGKICRTLPESFRKARYSGINRTAKLKQNPMRGKTKTRHHNAVNGPTKAGQYWAVWAPDWWTGSTDNNRVLLHQVVWAEANGATCVPKGYVVHHKDHNKNNNVPSNLELLSRRDHALHHAYHSYLERATTREKSRREQCSRSAEPHKCG